MRGGPGPGLAAVAVAAALAVAAACTTVGADVSVDDRSAHLDDLPTPPPAVAPTPPATFAVEGVAETGRRALVLYDTTGEYGWMGELQALYTANLASAHAEVTVAPVVAYQPGSVAAHDATFYLGSTYDEPLPAAFLDDVRAADRPVVWAGTNAHLLGGEPGTPTHEAFVRDHGWDPAASVADERRFASVTYRGVQLRRDHRQQGDLVRVPAVTDPALVSTVATASTLAGDHQVPWAIRSGALTYVGELPYGYVDENDRYLAYADIVAGALDPNRPERHRAMVRLEDVNPGSDLGGVLEIGRWLHEEGVPFSVGIVPVYRDPLGVNAAWHEETEVELGADAGFAAAVAELRQLGGTIVLHGYTHQWHDVPNPYNGTTGPDFEFFRARCSTTAEPPYEFVSEPADEPCGRDDEVVYLGPVADDSPRYLSSRVDAGLEQFAQAGLEAPTLFEFPHYAASVVDYATLAQRHGHQFEAAYERRIYPSGTLAALSGPTGPGTVPGGGAEVDYTRLGDQFFPYVVRDVFGQLVLPENLGNHITEATNNHPGRSAQDLVDTAAANLAVRDGFASFFYHPPEGLAPLQEAVRGIQALGYEFVSPAQVLASVGA